LAVLAPFVIIGIVALFEVLGLDRAAGGERALLVLIEVALALPIPMAWLARRLLANADALAAERDRLMELYGRARTDSLEDVLTGLGNHRAFQEELVRLLALADRHSGSLGLLLIDLDDLKAVNDERGHAGGDDVLRALGQIAGAVLRRSDRAYRVGGDEFAILLPNADLEAGMAIGRRILSTALEGGDGVHSAPSFSVSIGVAAYPRPSREPHLLYRQADSALYWAKRHGRTAVVAYEPARHALSETQPAADMSVAVGEMIAKRAFRPVYQPIFSLADGRVIGYEGLVRPTADAPIANASALFVAAETTDRVVELDFACLDVVAGGFEQLDPGVYLSVNLSPCTLESAEFHPADLTAIFRRHGIPLDQVVLELTERQPVKDLEQLRSNVAACRRAGMRLAADDVGAGNAGLRLLSEIQFDIVKIDLSLVQGGVDHDPSHGVIRALQELAFRWQASIVAEGVETAEQLKVVRALGLGAAQGFLLGRPSADLDVAPVLLDRLADTFDYFSRAS
jgi:diguanylate cyclase (GGDEF)-like protein